VASNELDKTSIMLVPNKVSAKDGINHRASFGKATTFSMNYLFVLLTLKN
jgi:hypothetical protein